MIELTEVERHAISDAIMLCEERCRHTTVTGDVDANARWWRVNTRLIDLLARDAANRRKVAVSRDCLGLLVRQAKVEVVASYYINEPFSETEIQSASNFAIAEAEAALNANQKGDSR